MTGRRVGDGGTASLLGIFDLPAGELWHDALKTIELPESLFSQPLKPASLAGKVTTSGAETLGVRAGIPFVVGSLDHHIAGIGVGLGTTAEVSESTGTVLACLRNSDEFAPKPGCCMGPGTEHGYYQIALSRHGASVLEWYQQKFMPESSVSELVALAEKVPLGSDGLIALPNANTFPELEGFVNRRPDHTPGHFTRAIMESVAAELLGLIDTLCPKGRPGKIVATGGGARSDLWLQIKADLLGVKFVATNCLEAASLGSAMLAAVGAGWFENLHQAQAEWTKINRVFTPTKSGQDTYAKWFENREQALGNRD